MKYFSLSFKLGVKSLGCSICLLWLSQSLAAAQTTIYTDTSPLYARCYQKVKADVYYDARHDRTVLSHQMATNMGIIDTTPSPLMATVETILQEKARLAYRIEKYFGSKQTIHTRSVSSTASSDSEISYQCPQPIPDLSPIDIHGFKKCRTQQQVAGTIHSARDIPGEAFNCIQFLSP